MRQSHLKRFAELFSGDDQHHGISVYTNEIDEKKGKRKAKSWTAHEPVTLELYEKHLDGNNGLGIAPIRRDGTVLFSVVDIDEYHQDLNVYHRIVYERKLPLIPFTSKSGGLHLYVFWEKPEPAKEVIEFLREVLAILGLKSNTEIFPKQHTLAGGGEESMGNWINLPYWNNGEYQYARNARGLAVPFADALDLIESSKTSIAKFRNVLNTLPAFDGPPCMQALLLRGDFDNRNEFFFSYGVYAKAKYGEESYHNAASYGVYAKAKYGEESYHNAAIEANNSLLRPLPLGELKNTVLKSLDKKTYSYKCKMAPIVDFCSRGICTQREFGISGSTIPGFDFGQLTQHKTEGTPYYTWLVNDNEMRFNTENEMIKQDKFRALAMRFIHRLPPRLKDETWTKIVNNALETMELEEGNVDVHSEGAILKEAITDYFTTGAHGTTIDAVTYGQIFPDNQNNRFIVKATDMRKYLENVSGLKGTTAERLEDVLSSMGAKNDRPRIGTKRQQVRVVYMPYASVDYTPTEPEPETPVDELDDTPMEDFSDFKQQNDEAFA